MAVSAQETDILAQAMISDLRADSARWRQEQKQTGAGGSHSPLDSSKPGITVPDLLLGYSESMTYQRGNAAAHTSSQASGRRRDADSPSMVDTPYGAPPTRTSRGQLDRGQVDAMQIDPPVAQAHADRGRYAAAQATRGGYQPGPDVGAYPAPGRDAGRDRYPEQGRPVGGRPAYQEDQPMMDAYGRPPATSSYAQEPRYAGNLPPPNDGVPAGYVRQGDYYVPSTSGYGQAPMMATSRPEPQQYPSGVYGQPADPQREPRGGRGDIRGDIRGDPRVDPRADHRGDPRMDPRDPRYGQGDYEASRYYPSPSATVASVGTRDPIASPSGPRFACFPRLSTA